MLTFQISYDFYGSSQTYDLLPEGAELPVTPENRELFVDLYVKYLLHDSVQEQFEAFKEGFEDVCKGMRYGRRLTTRTRDGYVRARGAPTLDLWISRS